MTLQVLQDAREIVSTQNATVQGVLLFIALLAISGLTYLFVQWKNEKSEQIKVKDAILKGKDAEVQRLNEKVEELQKARLEDLKYFDQKVVTYIQKIAEDVKENKATSNQLKDAILILQSAVNVIKDKLNER